MFTIVAYSQKQSKAKCIDDIPIRECVSQTTNLCEWVFDFMFALIRQYLMKFNFSYDDENIFLDCVLGSIDDLCDDNQKMLATNFFRSMLKFSRNNYKCKTDHFFITFPKFNEYFMQ